MEFCPSAHYGAIRVTPLACSPKRCQGGREMSANDPKRTFRVATRGAESCKELLIVPVPEGYVNAIGYESSLCLKSRLLNANPVTVSQTT